MKKRNDAKLSKGKNTGVRGHKENYKNLKGYPKTNIDTRDMRNGKILRRRKLNEKGYPEIDMDFHYTESTEAHKNDHVHKFNKVQRDKKHSTPTKKQASEMKKAKKKRKIWKW